MKFIDSHAHLSSNELYPDIESLLKKAKDTGLASIINICTDKLTLDRGIELVAKFPWVYNTAATTPHDVEAEGESFFPIVEKMAKNSHLVAIGETGLDYLKNHSPKEIQQDFLRRYLHLSLETNLPVIIHCREAFHDLFNILDHEYTVNGGLNKGVLHCFTGTEKEAEQLLLRGFYISISGIVTFKKSQTLQDIVKIIPLDKLLIETDAPYLAPQIHRGQLNEPAYIIETAAMIADLKKISLDELGLATKINAQTLFSLRTTL